MANVLIYSKDPCPYCVAAKRFLTEKNVAFEEKDLTNDPEEMLRLKDETGWRTFPMIFINGKLIGGYQDIKELDEQGKLDELLK